MRGEREEASDCSRGVDVTEAHWWHIGASSRANRERWRVWGGDLKRVWGGDLKRVSKHLLPPPLFPMGQRTGRGRTTPSSRCGCRPVRLQPRSTAMFTRYAAAVRKGAAARVQLSRDMCVHATCVSMARALRRTW